MATSTALYDPFNAHLVAGSAVASVRDENSSTGAVSTMIVGGGVSVRFTIALRAAAKFLYLYSSRMSKSQSSLQSVGLQVSTP